MWGFFRITILFCKIYIRLILLVQLYTYHLALLLLNLLLANIATTTSNTIAASTPTAPPAMGPAAMPVSSAPATRAFSGGGIAVKIVVSWLVVVVDGVIVVTGVVTESRSECIGVLRHMQRYFIYTCEGTDVQADWRSWK